MIDDIGFHLLLFESFHFLLALLKTGSAHGVSLNSFTRPTSGVREAGAQLCRNPRLRIDFDPGYLRRCSRAVLSALF